MNYPVVISTEGPVTVIFVGEYWFFNFLLQMISSTKSKWELKITSWNHLENNVRAQQFSIKQRQCPKIGNSPEGWKEGVKSIYQMSTVTLSHLKPRYPTEFVNGDPGLPQEIVFDFLPEHYTCLLGPKWKCILLDWGKPINLATVFTFGKRKSRVRVQECLLPAMLTTSMPCPSHGGWWKSLREGACKLHPEEREWEPWGEQGH